MANMMKMMKQAADMQKNMQKMQAEMVRETVRVRVDLNVEFNLHSVAKRSVGLKQLRNRCRTRSITIGLSGYLACFDK